MVGVNLSAAPASETAQTLKGKAPQAPDEPRRKRGRPRKHPVTTDVASTSASAPECPDPHAGCRETLQQLRDRIAELVREVETAKMTNREAIARCDQIERIVADMRDHMRVSYGYVHDPDY